MASSSSAPRISPGGRKELGLVQWTLLKIGSRRVGGPVPNVMLTLARHRGVFIPWLWYSSRLMPYGKLPATDAELVILRVASRCASDYERIHHTALGKAAGLGDDVIAWSNEPVGSTVAPPASDGIDGERAALVVLGADELIDTHTLGDETWAKLAAVYSEKQLIEFCLLTGQYTGLAATLNALRVPIESGAGMNRLR